MTPLTAAIIKGRTCAVKILLAVRPVDIECRDALGRSSMWWARRQGFSDLVKILLDEGQRRGISFEDEYPDTYAPLLKPRSSMCDVCCFADVGVLYCKVCNSGNFDICRDCFDRGGRCMDDGHVLEARVTTL